jgi:hypothetical protein
LFRKFVCHAFDFHVSRAVHVVCGETGYENSDKVGVVVEIDFIDDKLLIRDRDVFNFISKFLE